MTAEIENPLTPNSMEDAANFDQQSQGSLEHLAKAQDKLRQLAHKRSTLQKIERNRKVKLIYPVSAALCPEHCSSGQPAAVRGACHSVCVPRLE